MFILNSDDEYQLDIAGIIFVCESVEEDYELRAKRIALCYKDKLPQIANYMLKDIKQCYGEISCEDLIASLGTPLIDLTRNTLTYLEHKLDSVHILEIEFGGDLDEFFYFSIDG